jgi:protein-S-isoprenylcysteine O-methyltransferase Ste14
MNPLYQRALIQSSLGAVAFVALIFVPAGTWNYWQGWLFFGVFAATTISFTVHLARHDPLLLERRMNAGPQYERERSQKIIISLVMLMFFASIVLAALDHRFRISPVAPWVSAVGDAIVVCSFLFISWVTQVNSYAASNIRVENDQRVIDSGPYAYVRHPMYAGAVWLFVGMPLALGSWSPVALVVLVMPVLLWRLLDEERILLRDLPGYREYRERVRFRLIPYVW